MNDDVLFEPSEEAVSMSKMDSFRRFVTGRYGVSLPDSRALHQWSIENISELWRAVWDFTAVVGESGTTVVVNEDDILGARFFPDAKLNFAENCLRRSDDATALIACDEEGTRGTLTFGELREKVGQAQRALRSLGIDKGDRVAAYLPNSPDAIIYALATASIGALWSSCSPDFGAQGVIDRFGQIEAKLLIAADGYRYGGKAFDVLPKVKEVLRAIQSIEHTILVAHLDPNPPLEGLRGAHGSAGLLDSQSDGELTFAPLPFDHPLYVLYSSGTTGKPKCIVHGAGGTLLQHLKEHQLHCNISSLDRVFYFTTLGWMMWNWLVTALASEATLVLYDGNPFHPSGAVLFDMVDRERVNVFGTSAKFIDALAKAEIHPGETHDLSSLKTILSTGSPLSPEAFDFVYRHIKEEVHLASISGGTDIISCFVGGDPTRSVRRGEIQAAALGMDVQVWNENGERVVEEMGELVCTRPFPSKPIGFWGDEDGSRYRAAYFERFPSVWTHGDFTMETQSGGFVITGRSDATLNPGGVRIGTAEIYRPVEAMSEIREAIAIGQPFDADVRIVLFVVLAEGAELDDALRDRIRAEVRAKASPRHVPSKVLEVPAIPRTRSGKISELAVRRVVLGQEVKNVEALANPEALEHYRDRSELREG